MLQQSEPDDYVIATGQQRSVRDFATVAASHVGLHLEWSGVGINEIGIDRRTGREVVRVDPRYFRPAEVDSLLGDSSKARTKLGWRPTHSFDDLIREMVDSDIRIAQREAFLSRGGFLVNARHE
jgi:GDPmannose 4,6-dehydratase